MWSDDIQTHLQAVARHLKLQTWVCTHRTVFYNLVEMPVFLKKLNLNLEVKCVQGKYDYQDI